MERGDSPMRYGTIVSFFPAKGFGFIRPDSGPDIFFHVTALGVCEPPPQIEPGQPVKYELMSIAERKLQSQPNENENSMNAKKPVRVQAKLVELIDEIPGAILDESVEKKQLPRHPRARHRKPTWRR